MVGTLGALQCVPAPLVHTSLAVTAAPVLLLCSFLLAQLLTCCIAGCLLLNPCCPQAQYRAACRPDCGDGQRRQGG
jgi:hypothetical protein